jgi:hypothetical protein
MSWTDQQIWEAVSRGNEEGDVDTGGGGGGDEMGMKDSLPRRLLQGRWPRWGRPLCDCL